MNRALDLRWQQTIIEQALKTLRPSNESRRALLQQLKDVKAELTRLEIEISPTVAKATDTSRGIRKLA